MVLHSLLVAQARLRGSGVALALLPNHLHLIELLRGKHCTNHLLAHLKVRRDTDGALRDRIIRQLAVAKRGGVVLRAGLPRHRGSTVVAGKADMALLRALGLEDALVRSFAQLRAHAHVHLLVAALNVVRSLGHLGLI